MVSNLDAKFNTPDITGSPLARLDPSHPGTVIRYAFAIEAIANIIGGTCMLLYPASLLSLAVANPVLDVNRTSTALLQWLGCLVFGLTPQLVLGLANTRSAIESRPMVYLTLLAGEGFLIPMFFWQAVSAGSSGITPRALMVCTSTLVGPVLWRLWVLLVRPEWLGRWMKEGDAKKE